MEKGGDVDPMVHGQKIIAIFGFCDIRNFTDTTEILQEGVMLFVNEIAQIVHQTIDHYQGSANKNIGDAFLLVWKFDKEDVIRTDDDVMIDTKSTRVHKIADLSFISFLKVGIKINRSPTCLKYRSHPRLNERMPNYSVKMGFGLHIGWAIEGAIGSEYKIDASYLSPNVNMASRLEAATK
jgi:class 3 adenylate cyclase